MKTKVKKTNTNKRTYIFYLTILAFVMVLALASVLTPSAGVHHAGVRVGIRRAGVRMGVRRAGVCAGVRRAGVCAGVSCCHAGACLAVVRAFKQASVLLLCWHSHRCLSCCRAGVRVGVHHAGVCTGVCLAVVQAFEQVSVLLLCWHSRGHLSCCHAGVCAGIRHAAISTGIRRVCWCHVLVPRGWHSCHH